MTRVTKTARRPHLPRRTVRLRLTLVYGGLFLASGAVLLLITDLLWGKATNSRVRASGVVLRQILTTLPLPRPLGAPILRPPGIVEFSPAQLGVTPAQLSVVGRQLRIVAVQQHGTDLHQLIIYSAVAIAVMALLAIVLGWLMAGRVLRPLRTITTAARDISATKLHERLGLHGPDDELKELGDTFDDLLERLDGSFQAQRRFVANASHELRTPLATMRASLDVATGKPEPVPEETVTLANRLREELDHVDRLLESFLALARAQRGPIVDDATVSVDDLASAAIERQGEVISRMGLDVDRQDCPQAAVTGSETLLARMVDNVIDNAVTHNQYGGWAHVRSEADDAHTRLIVENGGPVFDQDRVTELAQPFRRLGAERTGGDGGTGLGLSIVASVAEAHGGTLELRALREGGFRVVIELPIAVRTLAGAPA